MITPVTSSDKVSIGVLFEKFILEREKIMLKKTIYFVCSVFVLNVVLGTQISQVATTFGIADATAKSIVNFILSASTAVSVISMIGIIFGVGGFSLAAVQTVKYLAKKSFLKAVV